MEFIQSIDWMQLLRCFVTGGGMYNRSNFIR